jgi:hypothetical protein
MDITKTTYFRDIKPAFTKILDHYNKQSGEEMPGENEQEPDEERLPNRKTIGTKSVRTLESKSFYCFKAVHCK